MVKLVHINKVGPSGDLYVLRDFHAPVGPDNSLPGSGGGGSTLPANPVFPDNSLPNGPPTAINPGEVLVMVRDQAGVWHYAAIQPGSPPPRPVPPGPPVRPDNTLPGAGGPQYPSGGPVPPPGTVAPKV